MFTPHIEVTWVIRRRKLAKCKAIKKEKKVAHENRSEARLLTKKSVELLFCEKV